MTAKVSTFITVVAGVSYYQSTIRGCIEGQEVVLVREPRNENAIKVRTSTGGRIGYISRAEAETLAPFMDEGGMVSARIHGLRGRSYGKPTVGVMLKVTLTPASLPLGARQLRQDDTAREPWSSSGKDELLDRSDLAFEIVNRAQMEASTTGNPLSEHQRLIARARDAGPKRRARGGTRMGSDRVRQGAPDVGQLLPPGGQAHEALPARAAEL